MCFRYAVSQVKKNKKIEKLPKFKNYTGVR